VRITIKAPLYETMELSSMVGFGLVTEIGPLDDRRTITSFTVMPLPPLAWEVVAEASFFEPPNSSAGGAEIATGRLMREKDEPLNRASTDDGDSEGEGDMAEVRELEALHYEEGDTAKVRANIVTANVDQPPLTFSAEEQQMLDHAEGDDANYHLPPEASHARLQVPAAESSNDTVNVFFFQDRGEGVGIGAYLARLGHRITQRLPVAGVIPANYVDVSIKRMTKIKNRRAELEILVMKLEHGLPKGLAKGGKKADRYQKRLDKARIDYKSINDEWNTKHETCHAVLEVERREKLLE